MKPAKHTVASSAGYESLPGKIVRYKVFRFDYIEEKDFEVFRTGNPCEQQLKNRYRVRVNMPAHLLKRFARLSQKDQFWVLSHTVIYKEEYWPEPQQR